MATGNNHWGEFEDKRQEDWSLSISDLEEQTLPSSSSPLLYQPSQEETASFQILPPEMCRSDPVVLHTIRLLQHQRQLLQLLTRPQTFGQDINAAPPPFPEDPPLKRKPAKFHYLNFLPPSEMSFTSAANKPQKFEIEASTARLILRKAIATLCAHTGYTDTTESVLRVITDATHDFLMKITSVLRSNKDAMMLTGSCPFHDVVEQTLHDMRLGGMAELHRMYKERVVNYHSRVRQRTLQLHHQYQTLLAHAGSTVHTQNLRRESMSAPEQHSIEETNTTTVATATNFSTYSLGVTVPAVFEDTSILSIKSNSSAEPDGSLQSYSVHSQTGIEEEQSPANTQAIIYSVSR